MEKFKKTERINSNKAMIDVSPKKIGEEIKVDSRRIRSILKSDKFKKNFGAESIGKNYRNPSIKYIVQAEIEDLMKLILKSYKDFEKIDKDTLSFDNGEKKIFDVAPLIEKGTVFETFSDLENFKQVYIDEEHCVAWDINHEIDSNEVWNNKVDLCSDACYIDSIPVG